MANSNSNGKFFLGLAIGAVVGAAVAYFSDREKRERFVETLSDATDRAKDSIVEGYYEAKNKYQQYRSRLSSNTDVILDEIRQELAQDDEA